MALVVETGSGTTRGEVVNSLSDIAAYATNHGKTFAYTGDAQANAEAAARKAQVRLDTIVRGRLDGYKTFGRDQITEFPRTDCTDGDDNDIGVNDMPREYLAAHCELAIYEAANPGGLAPVVTLGKLKKGTGIGPISVTYANTATADEQRPILTVVDDILSPLWKASTGFCGRAVRG